jgi:hypothetical protein
MVESRTWSNNIEINFLNHTAYVHASHVVLYSTSVELSVKDFCFMMPQDIIAEPKLKHIPKVLLLSSALPNQSESMNP